MAAALIAEDENQEKKPAQLIHAMKVKKQLYHEPWKPSHGRRQQ